MIQNYDSIHSNLIKPRPRGQILIREPILIGLRNEIKNLNAKLAKLTKENEGLRLEVGLAKIKLKKLSTLSTDLRYPPMRRIIDLVAVEEGISREDIMSIRRPAHICLARAIIYYLAKITTTMTFPAIGRELGGRDHSTVIYGCRKITKLREFDAKMDARLTRYQNQLRETSNGPTV